MDPATLPILAVGLASLLVGAAIGWLLASRPKAVYEERARLLAGQLQQLQVTQAENEGVARERVRALGETLEERAARISQLEAELDAAAISRTENDARVNAVIADTKQQFTDAFQALASKILDEKTAKFTATNETKLNELLNPLRERLKDFQKKIEDTHVTETAERRSLKDELKRLMDLNQQVSQDT
ncbi:MAG: DNA recombination protein RmuC, partial [Gammaproteobacteria bacterium]